MDLEQLRKECLIQASLVPLWDPLVTAAFALFEAQAHRGARLQTKGNGNVPSAEQTAFDSAKNALTEKARTVLEGEIPDFDFQQLCALYRK